MFNVIKNAVIEVGKKVVNAAGTKTGKIVFGGLAVTGIGALTASVLGKHEEDPAVESEATETETTEDPAEENETEETKTEE